MPSALDFLLLVGLTEFQIWYPIRGHFMRTVGRRPRSLSFQEKSFSHGLNPGERRSLAHLFTRRNPSHSQVPSSASPLAMVDDVQPPPSTFHPLPRSQNTNHKFRSNSLSFQLPSHHHNFQVEWMCSTHPVTTQLPFWHHFVSQYGNSMHGIVDFQLFRNIFGIR
jgi:hypothetical protein